MKGVKIVLICGSILLMVTSCCNQTKNQTKSESLKTAVDGYDLISIEPGLRGGSDY